MAVLKFDPQGNKVKRDQEAFYRLIGECINQWAFVDRALFNLCHLTLGTDIKRAATVFYSHKTINNHVLLADGLIRNALSDKKIKNRWIPLRKQVDDLLSTRSIIAHQPAKRTGLADAAGRAAYVFSLHIEPAERLLYRTHKGLRGKDELRAKDLQKHAKSIEKLVKRLSKLHRLVERQSKANA